MINLIFLSATTSSSSPLSSSPLPQGWKTPRHQCRRHWLVVIANVIISSSLLPGWRWFATRGEKNEELASWKHQDNWEHFPTRILTNMGGAWRPTSTDGPLPNPQDIPIPTRSNIMHCVFRERALFIETSPCLSSVEASSLRGRPTFRHSLSFDIFTLFHLLLCSPNRMKLNNGWKLKWW